MNTHIKNIAVLSLVLVAPAVQAYTYTIVNHTPNAYDVKVALNEVFSFPEYELGKVQANERFSKTMPGVRCVTNIKLNDKPAAFYEVSREAFQAMLEKKDNAQALGSFFDSYNRDQRIFTVVGSLTFGLCLDRTFFIFWVRGNPVVITPKLV